MWSAKKNSRSVSSAIKGNMGSASERVRLLEDGTRSKNVRLSVIVGAPAEQTAKANVWKADHQQCEGNLLSTCS